MITRTYLLNGDVFCRKSGSFISKASFVIEVKTIFARPRKAVSRAIDELRDYDGFDNSIHSLCITDFKRV